MEIKYHKGYHVITKTPEEEGSLPADGRSLDKNNYGMTYRFLAGWSHDSRESIFYETKALMEEAKARRNKKHES